MNRRFGVLVYIHLALRVFCFLREEEEDDVGATRARGASCLPGSHSCSRSELLMARGTSLFPRQRERSSPLLIEIHDDDESDDDEESTRVLSQSVSWMHALLVAALPMDGKLDTTSPRDDDRDTVKQLVVCG